MLIVDDVLATGGTAVAAAELVERLGAELLGISVLIELDYLSGRQRLAEAGIDRGVSAPALSPAGAMSEPNTIQVRQVRGRSNWTSQALVSLPARTSTPARELGKRALIALGLLAIVVAWSISTGTPTPTTGTAASPSSTRSTTRR